MIYAIGDSNMFPACTELISKPKDHNLVSVFSKSMQTPFRCWAKNGASNHWITAHVEYFQSCVAENDFLLVGWTSWEREEWPWIQENVSVCNGPNFGVPEPMKKKYLEWKSNLTEQYIFSKKQYWHDQIYQIHQQLKANKVRHLFWLTYDSFLDIEPQDWGANFFMPYHNNGCMYHYLKSHSYAPLKNDAYHFDAQAHQFWADALFQHSQQHNL